MNFHRALKVNLDCNKNITGETTGLGTWVYKEKCVAKTVKATILWTERDSDFLTFPWLYLGGNSLSPYAVY